MCWADGLQTDLHVGKIFTQMREQSRNGTEKVFGGKIKFDP